MWESHITCQSSWQKLVFWIYHLLSNPVFWNVCWALYLCNSFLDTSLRYQETINQCECFLVLVGYYSLFYFHRCLFDVLLYFAGVYSMCDGAALSHGPYLGTVSLCSFISILLLSIKACVFSMNSQIEAEASSYSPSRQRLHLKKSWGMPVLFLSSVVFALGHTVIAYRTSCRARRKLIFHRMDPEAVSPPVCSATHSPGFLTFNLVFVQIQSCDYFNIICCCSSSVSKERGKSYPYFPCIISSHVSP